MHLAFGKQAQDTGMAFVALMQLLMESAICSQQAHEQKEARNHTRQDAASHSERSDSKAYHARTKESTVRPPVQILTGIVKTGRRSKDTATDASEARK